MSCRLEARELSVVLGKNVIVHPVELSLEAGELHAIVGPSGCGKSTLLRALAGLVAPASGSIWLDGLEVTATPTDRRGVVMVFQDALLFPGMSVLDNVAYAARSTAAPRREVDAEARRLLGRVRLGGLEQRRPDQLSGGERQRVALARALMAKPRVLLLDEPLSALDAGLREELRALIQELQRELQLTTVVVTHDQLEAATLGQRVSVMQAGRLLQTAAPMELYRAPATEAVARFLGATNFLPAEIRGGVAQTSLGPLALASGSADGPTTLCIWPQDLEPGPGPNAVEFRVQAVTFNGAEQRVRVAASGIELEAILPRWTALPADRTITLRLPSERLIRIDA